MARKKSSKKAVSQEAVEQIAVEQIAVAHQVPAEVKKIIEAAPDPKTVKATEVQDQQAEALVAEVLNLTKGKDPDGVVWKFHTKDGKTAGASLGYFIECKLNEIYNGVPCKYDTPFPASGIEQQVLRPGTNSVKKAAKKNCPGCK